MTKKKFIESFAILAAVFLGSLEMGWRFFNMVVCCKRGEQKKERKKWFELSHIRENHPQNGYAREYNESKAWCFEQKMQDCYIKSIDGLKYTDTVVGSEGSAFGFQPFTVNFRFDGVGEEVMLNVIVLFAHHVDM